MKIDKEKTKGKIKNLKEHINHLKGIENEILSKLEKEEKSGNISRIEIYGMLDSVKGFFNFKTIKEELNKEELDKLDRK